MSFDEEIDRQIYPTLKWRESMLKEHFGSSDVLPLWIADMDFRAPPGVIDGLTERVEHGVFGYEYKSDDYYSAIARWYADRHHWSVDRNHIAFCPGVLSAISILIDQHSAEGDGIIVQPPVFFEFRMIIRDHDRRVVKNPLRLTDGKYQMDFVDLESKAADPLNKILILCNPHNPVGRVWSEEELTRVAEICKRHQVLVISDEIHGDIVYKGHSYTPFASLADELSRISFSCLSPAKTFNLSGIVDAMTIIPDGAYRSRFHDFVRRYHVNRTNVFASAAIEAAYKGGGPWLDEALRYMRANIDYMQSYLNEKLPQIKMIEPEGTYMLWLDFKGLGLEVKAQEAFLAQKARLALNAGYWFGREGAGYARMNIACPRSTLNEAMSRLSCAIDGM